MSHIQKLQWWMKRSHDALLPHQTTCRGHAMSTRVPEKGHGYCQLAQILHEQSKPQIEPPSF